MVKRHFWIDRLEGAWDRRSVVWLSGVRRAGKTFLSQSLRDIEYFDCELPRVRRMIDDPEGFLQGIRGRRIVLDEIHRLERPSEILKIAADHFPKTKILATGSSTLGASAKFRDTLAGRKEELWLTPMTTADLEDFAGVDLKHRLLHGGLPPFFLEKQLPEKDFQEWMDAYWAKDILELFRLERRHSFQRFFELLLAQSGGMFEASSFATPCEVSRTTIANYLSVLEATFVAHDPPFLGLKHQGVLGFGVVIDDNAVSILSVSFGFCESDLGAAGNFEILNAWEQAAAQGITVVVGPNGSGKSNVVDALAWVMGEQGAKSLRGGKMEDVIFAGTATKGPLGRAEVLLTIDNSDGALPIEYTEVSITRRMFRDGAGEYEINGSACRLLDIQELL
jgi:hypothetical protein